MVEIKKWLTKGNETYSHADMPKIEEHTRLSDRHPFRNEKTN